MDGLMLLTVMQIFRSVVDEPATWLYRPELARRRTTSRSPPVDVRLNRAAAPGGLSSSTGEEIFDGRPFSHDSSPEAVCAVAMRQRRTARHVEYSPWRVRVIESRDCI